MMCLPPVVSSLRDVVDQTKRDDTCQSGHDPRLPRPLPAANNYLWCPGKPSARIPAASLPMLAFRSKLKSDPDQRTQTSSAIFTQVAFALLTLSCAASRRQENNEENPVYRANKERDNNQVIYPGSTIRPDGLGLLRAEGA